MFVPLALLLVIARFSTLRHFELRRRDSPAPLPLATLFTDTVDSFYYTKGLGSPLFSATMVYDFYSSPTSFTEVALTPLRDIGSIEFSTDISLLLVSTYKSTSAIGSGFLPKGVWTTDFLLTCSFSDTEVTTKSGTFLTTDSLFAVYSRGTS